MGVPFKQLVRKHGEKVQFITVDFNACKEICEEEEIKALPGF
jgi:non-homologous end joining protein Ku